MLLRSTHFAGKGLALGVSAAAHAALLLAAHGGQAAADRADALAPIEPEMLVETVDVVPPVEDTPLPNRATGEPTSGRGEPPVARAPRRSATVAPALLAPSPQASSVAPIVTADPLPRFTIAIATTTSASVPVTSAGARDAATGDAPDVDATYAQDAVDLPARRVRGASPEYPFAARRDGVEADVPLVLVVAPDGAVERVDVARAVGHGLDEAAVAAARRFVFAPARKAGRAVRVRVAWTVQFRLE